MLSLIRFQKRYGLWNGSILLLGLVTSFTNLSILYLISVLLTGKKTVGLEIPLIIVFPTILVVSFLVTAYFQIKITRMSNKSFYNTEISILEKVRAARYNSFQKLGPELIYSAISDARNLSRVPEVLISFLNAIITLAICLFFLFSVHFWGGLFICLIMSLLLLIYIFRNRKIEKDLNKIRDLHDSFHLYLKDLLFGFKQISVSSIRYKTIFSEYISENRRIARELNDEASIRSIKNEISGLYSWYLLLSIIILVVPLYNSSIGVKDIAVFVTVILFMIAPVSRLITVMPFFSAVEISVTRLIKLEELLIESNDKSNWQILDPITSLRLIGVCYNYKSDHDFFQIEISDVKISKGDIVFIIGPNGSGKSTFINLITGLVRPESGTVIVNGSQITWEQYSLLADQMAVIFSDQYMFNENYDKFHLDFNNDRNRFLLSLFNLDSVVKYDESTSWIDINLSKGQQKRLSLFLAMLEDKPFLVLDEWAAEQDPTNRKLFYTRWLPVIREMGKTVVMVSHDDDYFFVADHIIRLDYGKIKTDTSTIQL